LPAPRWPGMMHRLHPYAMNKPARGSLLGIEHLED